jgi:PQQ-dependent catabolism-associated CXXCW motif protein
MTPNHRFLMPVALLVLAIAGMAMAPRPASAAPERRVALVIGNGKYESAPVLPNPANDARLIAATLAELGFEIVGGGAMLDLDKAGLEGAIRRFGQRLSGGDVGLFYYAGHGIQLRGSNYLIPVNGKLEREADVKYELVDAAFVLDEMGSAGTRLNMVILDACRNNPFANRGLRSIQSGLAQMQAPRGTVIGYATQPGAVALDGSGNTGPYASALAATMRLPGLRLFETFNEVGVRVQKETGGQQQPWLATSPIEGQFAFVPAAAPAPAAMPAPPAAPASPSVPKLTAVDQEFVTTGNANVRSQPSTESERVVALPPGTIVAATGKARVAGKDWYRVERDGKPLGFVIGDLLQPRSTAAAAPTPPATVPVTPPATAPPTTRPPIARPVAPPLAPLSLPAARRPSIDDVDSLPLDKGKAQAGYRDFLQKDQPRAFALSVTGAWTWRVGPNARRTAVEECNRVSKARCQLYAADDRVVAPILPEAQAFLNEDADFGVAPTSDFRLSDYGAATPASVPGARTIKTGELYEALQRPGRPVLVDVLNMADHRTLPSATWFKTAGTTVGKSDEANGRFERAVDALVGGDRSRPVVVFCLSAWCWESYNAALLLARKGFGNVQWYRGGTRSWIAAGLPAETVAPATW